MIGQVGQPAWYDHLVPTMHPVKVKFFILASLKSLLNKRKCPIELQFSLHKCPKPSWQGFRPPQNQANAHLFLANSSLKKCPKPSGQGLRPPPLTGKAQIEVTLISKVLP